VLGLVLGAEAHRDHPDLEIAESIHQPLS
jgi:hypothetical protein